MPAISLTRPATSETAADAWEPGPLRPRLADGAVHVWRVDLTTVTDDVAELLRPEERARAGRMLGERQRQLWVRSRGVLRVLLGCYLHRDARTLRFITGPYGKLALTDELSRECARLSFNVSHSRELALYAFAGTGSVGVDVEVWRRPIDFLALASRAFGNSEARRLQGLDPALREPEFLRRWTRHEAEVKYLGIGIGGASAGTNPRQPWIAELDVGPRAAGAVAAERRPREMRCWELLRD